MEFGLCILARVVRGHQVLSMKWALFLQRASLALRSFTVQSMGLQVQLCLLPETLNAVDKSREIADLLSISGLMHAV